MEEHGYGVEVAEGYEEALIRTRLALRGEGFSILTEMHVGGLLGPESGSERQYLIMSIWNAPAGRHELGRDLAAEVHLPCNVVVQETGASALVAALDPVDAADGSMIPTPIAEAARDALGRVLQRVGSQP